MNKIVVYFRRHWIRSIISFIIVAALSVTGFLLTYYLQGENIMSLTNGAAVGLIISLSIFGFSVLNRFGAFDTLGYGGQTFFSMFTYKQERKYKDLVEYVEVKNKYRKENFPYLVYVPIVLVFLVLLVIFEIKINSIL